MGSVRGDLRYALRTLLRAPAFAVIVVVTLGLGIGANTVVFSAVNGMALKRLGYPHEESVVQICSTKPAQGWARTNVSAVDVMDWRKQSTSFVDMGVCVGAGYNLAGDEGAERVEAVRASASLLPVLGFEPQLGRIFKPEEDQPGREKLVLLSDGFWRRRFGADPGIVDQLIQLDGEPYAVLGVLPAELDRTPGTWGSFDIWVPFAFAPEDFSRGDHSFFAFARLKPGVEPPRAELEMEGIVARLVQEHPQSNAGWGVEVVPIKEALLTPEAKKALWALTVSVVFVLLLVCVNVANLVLARAHARQQEFAIRAALGAGAGRLGRQVLTECAVLACAGAVIGVLLAVWGLELLTAALPDSAVPRRNDIVIDGRVLGFTVVLTVVTVLLFGLVPALRSSRPNVLAGLRSAPRSTSPGHSSRMKRDALVVIQVALALTLVIGAGLMVKSFRCLCALDPGFEARQLLTLRTSLPLGEYASAEQRASFFEQVLEKVRSMPGIEAAAAVSSVPCDRLNSWTYAGVPGRTPADAANEILVGRVTVTPGYFQTMGIPLLQGRGFTEQDRLGSRPVVVVSENLAQRYWPGQEPLGQLFKLDRAESAAPWRTVVGVVGDMRQTSLGEPPRLEAYRPHAQAPQATMSLVVRTRTDPGAMTTAIQSAIHEVDPDQSIYRVRSMADVIYRDVGVWGILAWLLGVFAAIALGLALVGLYGVTSYTVSQRTHEIGIRMALGACTPNVLRLVLGRYATLTFVGITVGVGLALLLGQVLEGLMHGVTGADPPTFVAVVIAVFAAALFASYLPARRAARVDPMVALRCE